jgi:hypothetical protein
VTLSTRKTLRLVKSELAELLAVNKTQINAWLKQAVADGKIQKLSRPVRYEWGKQESLML